VSALEDRDGHAARVGSRSADQSPRRDAATSSSGLGGHLAAVQRRVAIATTASNLVGAALVIVFLALIVPSPVGLVGAPSHVVTRNLILAAVYSLLGTVYGTLWDRRWFAEWSRWVASGEPPTEQHYRRAVRGPLTLLIPCAQIWGLAALLFAATNISFSWRLAFSAAFTVVLGGMVTAALVYLLSERLLRPLVTSSLARQAPERPVGFGVGKRLLLSWALVAGLPLLGIGDLCLHVLTDTPMSSSRLAASVLFVAMAALVSGVIAIVLAARSISDPLRGIHGALARVRAGELAATVPVYDGSEIGSLQAGFNEMVGGLREREQLRDLFGRHVGRHVAQRALESGVKLGGETRVVAVLFVDLVDSTGLALSQPPQQVVALLNRFFAAIVEVVARHDGWVNKFEGDAALCIFGAPLPIDDACACALKSARELCGRLARELPLRAGIGVSAGRVVAGNVGARERYEYTVIGDPVNEAARLCEAAKGIPEGALAARATVDDAAAHERSQWQARAHVSLRGRPRPTAVSVPVLSAPVDAPEVPAHSGPLTAHEGRPA
jgi:adenylate cyclase